MAITPVEIRHVRLRRGLFGYKRAGTDQLIDEIAASYEDVWRARADLADTVERLEQDLVRYRELEALLRTTLVSAERTAEDLKVQARRDAQLIIDEAHAEARAVLHRAAVEREQLAAEAKRIRTQLRAALEVVADDDTGDEKRRPEAA
jgi:cell division initiation protein